MLAPTRQPAYEGQFGQRIAHLRRELADDVQCAAGARSHDQRGRWSKASCAGGWHVACVEQQRDPADRVGLGVGHAPPQLRQPCRIQLLQAQLQHFAQKVVQAQRALRCVDHIDAEAEPLDRVEVFGRLRDAVSKAHLAGPSSGSTLVASRKSRARPATAAEPR